MDTEWQPRYHKGAKGVLIPKLEPTVLPSKVLTPWEINLSVPGPCATVACCRFERGEESEPRIRMLEVLRKTLGLSKKGENPKRQIRKENLVSVSG